ncbi:MAG: hypothetical protein RL367_510, partial [Pseudomonadota bacterium]
MDRLPLFKLFPAQPEPVMPVSVRLLLAALAATLIAQPTQARLKRITVETVKPLPVRDGQIPFEMVTGSFAGDLDPADPHNRVITDLGKAPRNAARRVVYSATFALTRPVDISKASGLLSYGVPNRGGLTTVGANQDGHIEVMSGWQGDIPPGNGRQTATVPVAQGVTGPVLARFTDVAASTKSLKLTGGFAVPTPLPLPVSLDTTKARLVRAVRGKPDTAIAASDWAFANCAGQAFPGSPDPRQICLAAGFDPDAAYTLVYQAKDPAVLGIGFAATRDLVSFLRHGKADDAGHANPAGTGVRWTIGAGHSQSGNFLRSFVNQGFNADEDGTPVFDGIHPNIAA